MPFTITGRVYKAKGGNAFGYSRKVRVEADTSQLLRHTIMLPIVLAHLNGSNGSTAGGQQHQPTASHPGQSASTGGAVASSIWSMWNNYPPFDGTRTGEKLTSLQHGLSARRSTGGSKSGGGGGGCFASSALPKNARSTAICSRAANFAKASRRQRRWDVSVVADSGELRFGTTDDEVAEREWIAHARLADDVQSNNAVVEICRQQTGEDRKSCELRLRVLRDLVVGEELMLWFSEELLVLLGIPFLTPANIRGELVCTSAIHIAQKIIIISQNKWNLYIIFYTLCSLLGKNTYTCNLCSRTFEYPNPLKIHMATDCDRLTRDDLWQRIDSHLAAENLSASVSAAAAVTASSSSTTTSPTTQHHHNHPHLGPFTHTNMHYLQTWLASGTFHHLMSMPAANQYPIHNPYHLLNCTPYNPPVPTSTASSPPNQHIVHNHSVQHPQVSAYQPPTFSRLSSAFQPLAATATASNKRRSRHASPATSSTSPMSTVGCGSVPLSYSVPTAMNTHSSPPLPLNISSPTATIQLPGHRYPPHQLYEPAALENTAGAAAAAESAAAAAAAHLETIVSNLGAHSAKQHQQQQQQQQQNPNHQHGVASGTSSVAGGHLCIYCGKVYSRKYGLKIHIRTHTGFKPLKCPYCSRPFGDPSNLNKHVRLHVQGNTIYRCPVAECDKILVRRRDLQRHMQTQHAMDDDGVGGVDGDGGGDGSGGAEFRHHMHQHQQQFGGAQQSGGNDDSVADGEDDLNVVDDEDRDQIQQRSAKRLRCESSFSSSSSSSSSTMEAESADGSFLVADMSEDD